MPFIQGNVTYARFRVAAGSPGRVDESLLSALEASVLRPTIGAPIVVETGFTGGRHILDPEFTHEHCVFGSSLHAAMRMDSVRVPAEIKVAYRSQEELALARASQEDSGRPLGRGARKEAKDNAERRWLEEVADGRYRSSKLVPLLWDVPRGHLLAPAGSDAVWSALRDLLQTAVGIKLIPLGAGGLALDLLAARGMTDAFSDAQADALVSPPTPKRVDEAPVGDRPIVPWAEAGPEPRDFLGNVFLLWLWARTETTDGSFDLPGGEVTVLVDRAIDMECAWGVSGKQTLRGDMPGQSPEASRALQAGKWPRKLGLVVADGEREWKLDLQGDLFRVSGLKLPRPDERPGSLREAMEERIDSTWEIDGILVKLYEAFLQERFSASWSTQRNVLRDWIASKGIVPQAFEMA
jgi:hypothetical protein